MSKDDLVTELALLRDTVQTGFARIDHYFELQQAQHLELRGDVQELRAEIQQLNRRVDRIEERLTALEHEFRSFRDWAAGEFGDVRLELRRLRQDVVDRDDALRRDVDALSQRVDRLERRLAEG
jgi:polyhydroxyalkanoate synthesis regulator phasin